MLTFAQNKLGQKVGDGDCTRLIEAALEAVGAKPGANFDSPGFYTWGRLVAAGETMLAGDIIQFAPGTRFQTPTSSLWMDSFFGHAAIIESISGTTITMLNQNMAGSPIFLPPFSYLPPPSARRDTSVVSPPNRPFDREPKLSIYRHVEKISLFTAFSSQ